MTFYKYVCADCFHLIKRSDRMNECTRCKKQNLIFRGTFEHPGRWNKKPELIVTTGAIDYVPIRKGVS